MNKDQRKIEWTWRNKAILNWFLLTHWLRGDLQLLRLSWRWSQIEWRTTEKFQKFLRDWHPE